MSTADVLSSANALLASHTALIQRVRNVQRTHRQALRALPSPPSSILSLPLIPTPPASPPPTPPPGSHTSASPLETQNRSTIVVQAQSTQRPTLRADLPPAKRARVARYKNYVPEEETIRNDYCQRYVDGGEWPQDWVVGAEMERRFEEYPKQQRLLALKKASVAEHSFPPSYLSLETSRTALQNLKFDVILIDPPFSSSFSWAQLEALPVAALAADPSFIFLWVGSGAGEGLERGREILAKWGYRRCEDICWVRTNRDSNKGPGTDPPTTSLLTRTKQHCLMGIRGTVRRSTDSWFVHCNIDTDVIIWEGDPTDPTRKPPEMYQLIENFCLGTRRLEIFGRYNSLKRGWVTVTAEELSLSPEEAKEKDHAVPFDKEQWTEHIEEIAVGGKYTIPITSEIESLRPKSPVPRGGHSSNLSNSGPSLPANPNLPQPAPMNMRPGGGGGSGGVSGGTMLGNAGGGSGGGNQNFNPHIIAQPMGMMNMNNIGGMGAGMGGNMGRNMQGMNAMGGMGVMGNMGNMGGMNNMGNMGGMGGGVNWNMGGGGAVGMGMAGGGNMGGMGGMPMNAMNMPMNTPSQGGAGLGFGYGFDGNMQAAPNAGGMGMNPNRGGPMGRMNMNMNMNQVGMGGMGPQAGGFGGQGGMGFNQPGPWMAGPGDFDGQQQYMGGMWDGSEGDVPMRMGMGMGQWGGGF